MPLEYEQEITNQITVQDFIQAAKAVANHIWIQRARITAYITIAGLIGTLYAIRLEPEFEAQIRLLPVSNVERTPASMLAGIAGVKPVTASNKMGQELYPELVNSISFRHSVYGTPITFSSIKQPLSTFEYFYGSKQHAASEGNALRRIRYSSELWTKKPEEAHAAAESTISITDTDIAFISNLHPTYIKRLKQLSDLIDVETDKKTGIVTIKGTMPDNIAAAQLTAVTAALFMDQISEYNSKRSQATYEALRRQYEMARQRADQSQMNLALFDKRNRVLTDATAMVSRQRLERNYQQAIETFQQIGRDFEFARLARGDNEALFTVLDPIVVPVDPVRPNRRKIVLIAIILGGTIALAIPVTRKLFANGNVKKSANIGYLAK